MKTISLQIANTFDREIRIQAAQLDLSRSDFIRAALEEKLARLATSVEAETAEKEARPVANVSEASAADRAGDTAISERAEGITQESNTR
jgi:hypothetical protein